MKIVLEVAIEKLESRADNTIKIVLGTQELEGKDLGALGDMKKAGYCKALLSTTNISTSQEKAVDEAKIHNEYKGKSNSKRFRDVLYRLWEQTDTALDSEDFYNLEMNKIIDHYKAKLE